MTVIGWIGVNVFRESVRDKVLYNLVAFAVLLIGASFLIGQLTAGQDIRIIKDLGLAATSIFGLFIAVFIGIGLVSKEVERRSIYSLLSKPVERYQVVLGKYLGLVLTLAVNLAVMAAAIYIVLAGMRWLEGPDITAGLEAPLLSAAFTFALWVAGRFSDDLRGFDQVVDSPAAAWMARVLHWVLPNFGPFDIRTQVVHGEHVAVGYVLITVAYGIIYILALLVAAVTIFSRRDFK